MKKAITLLVASAAGLAAAQNLDGQPDCAKPCIRDATKEAGCDADDMKCQCVTKYDAITNSATTCLLSACKGDDLIKAASAGKAACKAYLDGASTAGSAAEGTTTLVLPTETGASATVTVTSSAATETKTKTQASGSGSGSGSGSSGTGVSGTGASATEEATSSSTGGAAAAATLGAGLFAAVLGAVAVL